MLQLSRTWCSCEQKKEKEKKTIYKQKTGLFFLWPKFAPFFIYWPNFAQKKDNGIAILSCLAVSGPSCVEGCGFDIQAQLQMMQMQYSELMLQVTGLHDAFAEVLRELADSRHKQAIQQLMMKNMMEYIKQQNQQQSTL